MTHDEPAFTSLRACRSRWAWQALMGLNEGRRKKVTTRVQGLPLSLRSQGLGVAVAVLMREDKPDSSFLADLIGEWLLKECPATLFAPTTETSSTYGRSLLAAVMKCTDAVVIGAATEEAIALAGAVKLLASALAPEAVHEG